MAECILMQGGGGVQSDDLSATSANVLNGKTYMGSDTDSDVGTGTMQNNGAVNKTYYATTSLQTYTVPQGYHNGSGKVNVGALSQLNLSASNIKKGVTVNISNGNTNVYSVIGTLPYTPKLAQLSFEEPNNNNDYGKGANEKSGKIRVNQNCYVYYKWDLPTQGTSAFEIYVNGTRVSTASSGVWEGYVPNGAYTEFKYLGAHQVTDYYGKVFVVGMITV